jgi:hypothetical protein
VTSSDLENHVLSGAKQNSETQQRYPHTRIEEKVTSPTVETTMNLELIIPFWNSADVKR